MPATSKTNKFREDGPFSHIVTFEWHDGPIKGLAVSSSSSKVYYFHLLDGDESLDHRIFALFEIDRNTYDDCVRVLSDVENPKYPIWCPPISPGQIDFSKWSLDNRERLTAIVAVTPYLEKITGSRDVKPNDQINVQAWSFDETQSPGWVQQFFGAINE